jgi:hypothetical protein
VEAPEERHKRRAFAVLGIDASAPEFDDQPGIVVEFRKVELRFGVEPFGRLASARKQAVGAHDLVAVDDQQVVAEVVVLVAVHARQGRFRQTFAELLVEDAVAKSQGLFELFGRRSEFDLEAPAREAFFQSIQHASETRRCTLPGQAESASESPEIVTP